MLQVIIRLSGGGVVLDFGLQISILYVSLPQGPENKLGLWVEISKVRSALRFFSLKFLMM